MTRFCASGLIAFFAFALTASAQNTSPVVTNQIADFTEYAGAPARSLDLTTFFSDPDASAAVRFTSVLGDIDLFLYGQQKPLTVANFLKYIDQGRYFKIDPANSQLASSFIHRSVPGFVIQGGGYLGTVDAANPNNALATAVATFPAIQNEPGISNKRGTIAMAKQPSDPNSATSQWFINLADNGGAPNNLDTQNGGFPVFGRVTGSGMAVADSIAAVPRYNFGLPFDMLPLRNYTSPEPVKVEKLVSLPGIAQISPLNFAATSDNPTIADVTISGTKLLVTGKQPGSAHITVTATDLDGATASQSFNVTVYYGIGIINISTRLNVGTDDNVMIGGFIIGHGDPKRVMIRAIGPSLSSSGIAGALADPTLELHDSSGAVLATNDDWESNANKQDIIDSTIAPTSPKESAILTTLPGSPSGSGVAYTAVVRGANNTTGVGLVEVYDLDSGPGATGTKLLNISTRGKVQTGDNVMIGGFIIRPGSPTIVVVVRAIGPSLQASGVAGVLADPTLELHDSQGAIIDSNNDWQTHPKADEIQADGLAPKNPRESAMLDFLRPGNYTAIVRGVDGSTGVGLVEAYTFN